jgi:hypothetical protein
MAVRAMDFTALVAVNFLSFFLRGIRMILITKGTKERKEIQELNARSTGTSNFWHH